MRTNLPVTQNEIELDEAAFIVTKTDLEGRITSVNQDFLAICGYGETELLGQPHNVIRHPDVPSAVFADLWKTLKIGKSWSGVVKNRAKNGDHYWVETNVAPLREEGTTIGYVSFRKKASRQQVKEFDDLYREMRENPECTIRFVRGQVVRGRSWGARLADLSPRTMITSIIGVLALALVIALAVQG